MQNCPTLRKTVNSGSLEMNRQITVYNQLFWFRSIKRGNQLLTAHLFFLQQLMLYPNTRCAAVPRKRRLPTLRTVPFGATASWVFPRKIDEVLTPRVRSTPNLSHVPRVYVDFFGSGENTPSQRYFVSNDRVIILGLAI